MRNNFKATGLVFCFVFILSGCVGAAKTPLSEVVGETLDVAQEKGGSAVIYDLSPLILDTPQTYDLGAGDSSWTVVVVACRADTEDRTPAFGILRATSMTPAIRKKAKAGEYRPLLVECN